MNTSLFHSPSPITSGKKDTKNSSKKLANGFISVSTVNDDDDDDDDDKHRYVSADMPKWLRRHHDGSRGDMSTQQERALEKLLELRNALLSYCDFGLSTFNESRDVEDVINAVLYAAQRDWSMVSGAAEFLTLLVHMGDDQPGEILMNSPNDDTFSDWNDGDDEFSNWSAEILSDRPEIISRDTLIASAFHYCDCINARRSGMYDMIDRMVTSPDGEMILPPASSSHNDHSTDTDTDTESFHDFDQVNGRDYVRLEEKFGPDPFRIARDAARIKRAEIMAYAVVGNTVERRRNADGFRDLLLTVSGDWRALAVRAAAALYRMQGILLHDNVAGGGDVRRLASLTSSEVVVFRDALSVYAPLSGRLGLDRLKRALETTAFRTLWPMQYRHAMRLYYYQGRRETMQTVASFLTERIREMLVKDEFLVRQLESVEVTSRVKDPYSLWKKMVKLLVRQMEERQSQRKIEPSAPRKKMVVVDDTEEEEPAAATTSTTSSLTLSSSPQNRNDRDIDTVPNIPDAIALRVILQASPNDDHATLQERERLLCYYVQKICMDVWPPTDDRVKDYIKYPKPNGYQSLQYTSGLFRNGEFWPFELQIRSREMHNNAEFGIAAHWSYKMNGKESQSKVLSSSQQAEDSVDTTSEETCDTPITTTATSKDTAATTAESPVTVIVDATTMTRTEATVESFEAVATNTATTASNNPYFDALTSARANLTRKQVLVLVSRSDGNEEEDDDHHHHNHNHNVGDDNDNDNDESGRGEIASMRVGATLWDVLRERSDSRLDYDAEEDMSIVVVALNGRTIERRYWDDTELGNGDVITIW